jgi:hypothetical protein
MSLGLDVAGDVAKVRAAYADGTLQDQDWLPGNIAIGHHQFNDCLILLQTIDQRATPGQLAISPIIWTDTPGGMCEKLHAYSDGRMTPPPPAFYHRYLHGHTTLARYLLPQRSVADIRELYKTTEIRLIALGIIVAMIVIARRRRVGAGLVWLAGFLAFSRFFGLDAFGQSLGHGPADIVFLAAMLTMAATAIVGGVGRRTILGLAALFGALTIVFEFLTGGLPLGSALVIGGAALMLRDKAVESPLRIAGQALAAFWAAVATVIGIKLILVAWIFGGNAVSQILLSTEMRMTIVAATGPVIDTSFHKFFSELFWCLDSLAPGLWPLPPLMIALAVAGGSWALWTLRGHPDQRVRQTAWLLAGSNLALLLWVLATRQHIVLHAWFMDRIFAWTIASGFGLFALALLHERPQAD